MRRAYTWALALASCVATAFVVAPAANAAPIGEVTFAPFSYSVGGKQRSLAGTTVVRANTASGGGYTISMTGTIQDRRNDGVCGRLSTEVYDTGGELIVNWVDRECQAAAEPPLLSHGYVTNRRPAKVVRRVGGFGGVVLANDAQLRLRRPIRDPGA